MNAIDCYDRSIKVKKNNTRSVLRNPLTTVMFMKLLKICPEVCLAIFEQLYRQKIRGDAE